MPHVDGSARCFYYQKSNSSRKLIMRQLEIIYIYIDSDYYWMRMSRVLDDMLPLKRSAHFPRALASWATPPNTERWRYYHLLALSFSLSVSNELLDEIAYSRHYNDPKCASILQEALSPLHFLQRRSWVSPFSSLSTTRSRAVCTQPRALPFLLTYLIISLNRFLWEIVIMGHWPTPSPLRNV